MMDALTIKDWVKEALELSPKAPKDAFLKSAIELAWMLANALSKMVAAEEVELQDINVDNVIVFVQRQQPQTLRGILANEIPRLCGISAVYFQCELPMPGIISKPLDSREVCAALGEIFLELFSSESTGSVECSGCETSSVSNGTHDEHATKRRTTEGPKNGPKSTRVNNLLLGMPRSILSIVGDLLGAGNDNFNSTALTSLDDAMADLTQMRDHPEKFLFDRTCPEKALEDACLFGTSDAHLFGREMATKALRCAKKRVFPGNGEAGMNRDVELRQNNDFLCEAVFLHGYAGSGKSHQLRSTLHSCTEEDWFVLKCNFSKHADPVMVVAGAFDDFFAQSERLNPPMKKSFDKVCRTFLASIDFEGLGQLCALIPNLSQIFLPASPEYTSTASMGEVGTAVKRRLYFFHILFMSLASCGRPVIIMLDDLQFGLDDSGKSFVLQGLADFVKDFVDNALGTHKGAQMLIVGTFRSNEVKEDNDILAMIKTIKQSKNVNVTMIPIGELTFEDITKLISTKLGLPTRSIKELASLVHTKTRGNAFFVLQFLRSIIQNKMLVYSVKSRTWKWDCDILDMLMISHGVAELLVATFDKLPSELRKTLEIVACFGTQVSDSTLGYVLNSDQEVCPFDLHGALLLAIEQGILEKAGPIYQFTHDIIHEAIYGQIPLTGDSSRPQLHKKLGRSLLQSQAHHIEDTIDQRHDCSGKRHLLATDQINKFCKASAQINSEERSEFASINAKAAKFAIAASSFEQAQSYLNEGMKLLETNHWEENYSLSLDLYEQQSAVCCMLGDVSAMQIFLNALLLNANSMEDSLPASILMAKLLAASSNYTDAICNCLDILRTLGETLPQHMTPPVVLNELSSILPALRGMTSEKLRTISPMTNERKLNAMKVMSILCVYSNISKPILVPLLSSRMVLMTYEYGFCEDSIVGIVFAGQSVISFTEDIKLCYHLNKVVEPLIEESPNRLALRAKLVNFDCASKVIVEPAHLLLECLPARHYSAMQSGDVESAMKCVQHYCVVMFRTGSDLALVSKHLIMLIQKAESYSQNPTVLIAMSFLNAVTYLTGKDLGGLNVKSYDELNMIGEKTSHRTLLWHNAMNEMSEYFWMRNYDLVDLLSQKQPPSHNKRVGRFGRALFEGISSLRLARATGEDVDRRRGVGEQAAKFMGKMEDISKWNFRNKAKLLQAELFYLNGDLETAEFAYMDSIVSAHDHKYFHEEALAFELYGMFCIENQMLDKGAEQLRLALGKYEKWGAMRKVDDLQLFMNNLS